MPGTEHRVWTDYGARARFRDSLEQPSLVQLGKVYRYEVDLWNTAQVYQDREHASALILPVIPRERAL